MQTQVSPSVENVKAVFLTAEDLKVAASILYKAYHDDPLFQVIFDANDDGYEARLRAAIREELAAFWQAKLPMIGLFDESRLLAVTCVITPESGFGPQRFWHWRLKMLLTAGYVGTRQMVEKEQVIQDNIPADVYHVLSFIGVAPEYQHLGLGHILLGAIDSLLEEQPQSEGIAVLLTVDKYRSFFSDANFKLVKPVSIGEVGGDLMFRPRA